MSDQIFWYLSRSSALVAWFAAAGSIIVGAMIPSRLLGRRPTIPWLTDLHRMLAAVASIFLLIHMVTLWFDHFVAFRLADLLVPFVAEVPGLSRTSLALGVIAAWLTAAVELSSLIRARLPEHAWRTIHLGSYGIVVLGTFHAALAGSDIGNPIIASLGTSALTAVVLMTAIRIRRLRQVRRRSESAREADHGDPDDEAEPVETWIYPSASPGMADGWPDAVSPIEGGTRPPAGHHRPEPWANR